MRFVAAFVDELDRETWSAMGVALDGEAEGAPSYHPRLLLGVWLYGFMTGVRSARKLEAACQEQLPFLWLTAMQRPDHNTLWRFYREHRSALRNLIKETVRTAVNAGLVDLAWQAVDGTKMRGNAAKAYNASQLEHLLAKTEGEIAKLEAQNAGDGEAQVPRLPRELSNARSLRERVKRALERSRAAKGPKQVSLTDPDAGLLKGHKSWVLGYNSQAVASPLKGSGRGACLITAVDVSGKGSDNHQLVPMVDRAAASLGEYATVTLADTGYHSGSNLEALKARGQVGVVPEIPNHNPRGAYNREFFSYDKATDSYLCPQGETLRYAGRKTNRRGEPTRTYMAQAESCRHCPAFGECTTNWRHGARYPSRLPRKTCGHIVCGWRAKPLRNSTS